MAVYSLIQAQNYFNLTLPKAVVDVCNMIRQGETGVFHFLEAPGFGSADRELSSVFNQELRTRTRLLVKKLSDGSWNLTNIDNKSGSDEMTKNVYIIENTKKKNIRNDTSSAISQSSESKTLQPSQNIAKSQEHTEDEGSRKDEESDLGVHDHDYTGGDADTSKLEDSDGEDSDANMQTITCDEEKKIIIVKSGELNDNSKSGINKNQNDSAYKYSSQFTVSRRLHGKDSPSCPYCHAKTKDAFNMIKHMKRKHSKEVTITEEIEKLKPLASEKCKLCARTFLNRKTLKEHMLNVHQEFKAIQCPHCEKKYRTPYHMKMHIKHVHLRKPKSFACDHCTRRFDTKKVLQTHILYHHSKIERVHKCELCDYKYAFPKQYYEHRTRVHGPKKEICPYCGYKCATRWYMNKHMVSCSRNKYTGSERQQKVITADVKTIEQAPVLCQDSLSTESQPTEYQPTEIPESFVEVDQRELSVPEVSDSIVEMPPVWDVQTPVDNIAMDTVILNTDEVVEEQVIVIKQEEPCQQFTIMGPDGSQHIVQLVYPDT